MEKLKNFFIFICLYILFLSSLFLPLCHHRRLAPIEGEKEKRGRQGKERWREETKKKTKNQKIRGNGGDDNQHMGYGENPNEYKKNGDGREK